MASASSSSSRVNGSKSSSMSLLRPKSKSKQSFNMVVMGDRHVGKTELLRAYVEHYFTKFDSHSLSSDNNAYIKTTCIDGVGYTFHLWEWASTMGEYREPVSPRVGVGAGGGSGSAGCGSYTTADLGVLQKADVFLICYAINNVHSFKNMEVKWIPIIKKYAQPKKPVILVGTKLDLKHSYGGARVTDLAVQKMKFRTKASSVLECSARKFEGVAQVFKEALSAASAQRQLHCILM